MKRRIFEEGKDERERERMRERESVREVTDVSDRVKRSVKTGKEEQRE